MRRNGSTLAILAAAAAAALYLKSKSASAAAATPAAGGAAGSPLTDAGSYPAANLMPPNVTAPYQSAGNLAPSAPAIELSGSFWDSLTPTNPLPDGYVNFPSGSQAAAALLTTRADALGNLYVQWAGLTYQLGPQDALGNYPATEVNA